MFCLKKWFFVIISFISFGGNFFAALDPNFKDYLGNRGLQEALVAERKNLIDYLNSIDGMTTSEREATVKEFEKQFALDFYKDVRLVQNSVFVSRLPKSMQTNPLVKKFVLPSEGAFMLTVVAIIPHLFTTIFRDGVLKEGTQRLYRKIRNMLYFSDLISTSDVADDLSLNDLVLEPEVYRELLVIIKTLSDSVKNKGRVDFGGLLFYGDPGTGKTQAARVVASVVGQTNDIFYHEISGKALADASHREVLDLIDSLKGYKKLAIVLIDECDSFLMDRDLLRDEGRREPEGLVDWLSLTSEESSNILFIYTTNYRDKLEFAMFRRALLVEFVLPGLESRYQLLSTYFNKYFFDDAMYAKDECDVMRKVFTPTYFKDIASRLLYENKNNKGRVINEDKFSPADIKRMISRLKNFSMSNNINGVPNKESSEYIVNQAIKIKGREVEIAERKEELKKRRGLIGPSFAVSAA